MKKLTYSQTYKKGTQLTNKEQVIQVVKDSDQMFIKKQSEYDDKTQSMLIEFHFKS